MCRIFYFRLELPCGHNFRGQCFCDKHGNSFGVYRYYPSYPVFDSDTYSNGASGEVQQHYLDSQKKRHFGFGKYNGGNGVSELHTGVNRNSCNTMEAKLPYYSEFCNGHLVRSHSIFLDRRQRKAQPCSTVCGRRILCPLYCLSVY